MPLYEHVFLGRQDISSQQFEGLIETYKTIIKDNGGSTEKTEYWGLKNLSFKIKKNRKAHFALLNIDAPHDAVAEMERQMGISTDVIRFLTLRLDELEEGPSAMMKRGDRDDRRPRGRDRDGPPRDRDGPSRSRSRDDNDKPAKSDSEKPAKSENDKPAKTDGDSSAGDTGKEA